MQEMEVKIMGFENPLDLDALLFDESEDNYELTNEDFEVASCGRMSFACQFSQAMAGWYKAGQT